MQWQTLNITKSQIKSKSTRSTLISCPFESDFAGYAFWHPAKLVRQDINSAAFILSYNEQFKFRLIKYGANLYSQREEVSSVAVSSDDIRKIFNQVSRNIKDNSSYLEIIEPAKLILNVEVKPCLKNN